MSKEKHEAKVEKKLKARKSTRSPLVFVRLFSDTIGFYIGLVIYDPINRLFEHPQRLIGPYIKKGQVAADIGCGLGNYTLALAESVGHGGKVYAVDLDKKCIQALRKKTETADYGNIEAHVASASDLGFIKDKSVDFVLANGLL